MTEGKRLTVICGAFGTGKTEVAINVALKLREQEAAKVFLVDLDIVNLYFRSRQRKKELEQRGIRVISSRPGLEEADLPALSPEILDSFAQKDSDVVFDLGGSDLGGVVLSRFNEHFRNEEYNHWLVVNPYRPFNEKNEDTIEMAEMIARRARLPITGMIANPHLLNETNYDIITSGFNQVKEIRNYPLKFLTVMEQFYQQGMEHDFDVPILVMEKQLWQPWEDETGGPASPRAEAST